MPSYLYLLNCVIRLTKIVTELIELFKENNSRKTVVIFSQA